LPVLKKNSFITPPFYAKVVKKQEKINGVLFLYAPHTEAGTGTVAGSVCTGIGNRQINPTTTVVVSCARPVVSATASIYQCAIIIIIVVAITSSG